MPFNNPIKGANIPEVKICPAIIETPNKTKFITSTLGPQRLFF
jgi:hypothetical protein